MPKVQTIGRALNARKDHTDLNAKNILKSHAANNRAVVHAMSERMAEIDAALKKHVNDKSAASKAKAAKGRAQRDAIKKLMTGANEAYRRYEHAQKEIERKIKALALLFASHK